MYFALTLFVKKKWIYKRRKCKDICFKRNKTVEKDEQKQGHPVKTYRILRFLLCKGKHSKITGFKLKNTKNGTLYIFYLNYYFKT